MTTAKSIIQSAYREGNLIPAGTTPTAAEQAEALERLNRLVQGTYGFEMGENLADWQFPAPQRTAPIAANYPGLPFPTDTAGDIWPLPIASDPTIAIYPYPPVNTRVVFGGVAGTLFFPEAPLDGARMGLVQGSGAGDSGAPGAVLTLDGNGRTIQGSATKTFTDPVVAQSWLYRADLADWTLVADMAITDNMPFPSELDDLWICALAIRLGPRFNKPTMPETAAALKVAMTRFKARYRQAAVITYGSSDIPRSLQSYISGRWWW